MPTLSPGKKFSSPELLSQVRSDLLVAWLWPMRDYFAGHGCPLESAAGAAGGPGLDYDRLAALFLAPGPEMPAELLEALYLFRELDSPAAMDALHGEARRLGLDLGLAPDATPLDVAVRAWMLDRRLVETVHHRVELSRPRAFRCFVTGVRPPPPFPGPTPGQIAALESRLDHFYAAWKRGKGAKVFVFREDEEWVFLVRHGAPCRREGAMRDDRPTTVFFRPQRHDVLKYHPARGELRVHCCGDRERRVLLRAFGRCLFGRPDFFPGAARYTLAPLVRSGRACLACADVPGLEAVRLVGVELRDPGEPPHTDIRKAQDIFCLVESGKLAWPLRTEDIRSATFQVKFWRAKRPRALTVVPGNRVIYGREEDGPVLDNLLRRRGFIEPDHPGDAFCE